jgi:creatinine amidohydrolase
MSRILWSEFTRDELRAQAPGATLLVPVAATEQHGPHLPTGTDACICTALTTRVADALSGRVPVVVAPTLPFGFSAHHQAFAGVLTLSAATMTSVLRELGESAVKSGFRRIFYLNAHGGNDEMIRIAAREVALAHPVRVAAASYWSIAGPALTAEGIEQIPGHAGMFETCLVQALHPDLVRADKRPITTLGHLQPGGPGVFAAQSAQDFARLGGYTDPSDGATAALGEQLLTIIVREVAGAVAAFHEVD